MSACSMVDFVKLKQFMLPYYQETTDYELLTAYLTQYGSPECAASALWYERGPQAALQTNGLTAIDTGAEKFKYAAGSSLQEICNNAGDYYKKRCQDLNGIGSSAIRVAKPTVAGVPEIFGS